MEQRDATLDHLEFWDAHAALEWQIELGASEPIAEKPVNRYEIPAAAPKAEKPAEVKPKRANVAPKAPEVNAVEEAALAAQSAASLESLREALAGFEHCPLKRGARNLAFSDGDPAARVMVIGDAPSRDDDIQGKPFTGREGALCDAMFAAIGLSREATDAASSLYLTNVLPWRPPQNRDPSADEIAMMKPFVLKHIELAQPKLVVLMGNMACRTLLGRDGVSRLRGQWQDVMGLPAMPMVPTATLLRTPIAKRDAWADLLDIKARLAGLT